MEDQDPFLLTNFIADRRSLLKRPPPKSNLHLSKPKPISHSSDFPPRFCRTACLFSFNDSPDFRTSSPFFEFHSPGKSPRRNSNSIFLHVPATTAGLLLEAALRIQKQSTPARSKTPPKSNGLGFFGTFLKRLTHRCRAPTPVMDRDCRRNERREGPPPLAINDNDSVFEQSKLTSSDVCESNFCDSPFRFVLHSSPSPGHRTPEFSSPATSPTRSDHQVFILLFFVSMFQCSWPSNFIVKLSAVSE